MFMRMNTSRMLLDFQRLLVRKTKRQLSIEAQVPESQVSKIISAAVDPSAEEMKRLTRAVLPPGENPTPAVIEKLFSKTTIDPMFLLKVLTPTNFDDISTIVGELIKELPSHEQEPILVALHQGQQLVGRGNREPVGKLDATGRPRSAAKSTSAVAKSASATAAAADSMLVSKLVADVAALTELDREKFLSKVHQALPKTRS